VAQVPQLICPYRHKASRADDGLPTLETAGELATTTVVLRPVQLALPAVT
jgi:hypothetical protein